MKHLCSRLNISPNAFWNEVKECDTVLRSNSLFFAKNINFYVRPCAFNQENSVLEKILSVIMFLAFFWNFTLLRLNVIVNWKVLIEIENGNECHVPSPRETPMYFNYLHSFLTWFLSSCYIHEPPMVAFKLKLYSTAIPSSAYYVCYEL